MNSHTVRRAAGETPAARSPRDPQGRRHAIVEAAAELIAESGALDITHRQVAARARVPLGATTYYFSSLEELIADAVALLAEQTDAALADLEAHLIAAGGTPTAIAGSLWTYLSDTDQVRADTVVYFAGIQRADLAPLTRRWFEGQVRILARFIPERAAHAVAVFMDGAMMNALANGAPMDREAIENAVTALIVAYRPKEAR